MVSTEDVVLECQHVEEEIKVMRRVLKDYNVTSR